MLDSLETLTTPPVAAEVAPDADAPTERICVECGGKFEPPAKGPGQHKKFCDTPCRQKFANREKAQGAVLVTIAKVYIMTRHGRTPEDRLIRGNMQTEMTRILSHFIALDKREGRAKRLRAYAKGLVNVDANYHDRRRKD